MVTVITTDDGSSSLYVTELDETYHSRHGALAESEHIYINEGLRHLLAQGAKTIDIFEMGFGTGLNAILTYKEWLNYPGVAINYITLDNFPLGADVCRTLIYKGITDSETLATVFGSVHKSTWGIPVEIAPGFTITKHNADIHNWQPVDTYNLIYYDAFAPSKQPDVWQPAVLEKITGSLQPGGVLVTYCSGGAFKRTLKDLKMDVYSLPGPVGKKEITRAIKNG